MRAHISPILWRIKRESRLEQLALFISLDIQFRLDFFNQAIYVHTRARQDAF